MLYDVQVKRYWWNRIWCRHGRENQRLDRIDYPNYQMTIPNQVPSKRPDPVGPVEG